MGIRNRSEIFSFDEKRSKESHDEDFTLHLRILNRSSLENFSFFSAFFEQRSPHPVKRIG